MDGQQNQVVKISNKNLALFLTFSVVAALSVLINARVFYIVFLSSKRKSRPANVLVAHLSFVVIGFTMVICFYLLEKTNMISMAAPGICNIFSFLRNNIHYIFPVNAGVIIWIRTRSNGTILRKSFAYRCIGIMWLVTILANLPSTFMVEYVRNQDTKFDKCKEIPLLGSFVATIVYESVRFFLFNVLVCLYLIRAAIKIRSSIKYLGVLENERQRKRLQQIRFVYLHTIVFILNWFPNSLGLFLFKIFSRLGWTTDYVKFLTPFVFFNYSAFVLCPLSYVFLLEDMSITTFFAPCLRRNSTNLKESLDHNGQEESQLCEAGPILKYKRNTTLKESCGTEPTKAEDRKEENSNKFEAIEMSGMTTVGLTETNVGLPVSAPKSQSIEEPIEMENSARPATLTPTTSSKLKRVEVQLHIQPERKQSNENEQESSEHSIEFMV